MKDKNKLIVLVSGIVVILLMVAGISFAIFRFGTDSTNQELVLGDIWMKYTESNGISLENALPGDEYTNYFEFTITGTNTYTKKDIFYDISLTHGDIPAGKTEDNRVEDKYLKFKLTEVVGNTETEIFTDKTYDDLTNKRVHVDTISKSTSTFSKTYRLYMVLSEELTYGNSDNAILTTEEFGKIFGSIKVNVTGDFNEKEVDTPVYLKDVFKEELLTRTNSYILEDDTFYVSGKKDDNNLETRDDIDFNYVWYSGKLWRITAINPDGTLKMITDDIITTLNWGATGTVSDTDYTSTYSTSYIREWLNQEFLPTLYNYENIIDEDAGWYSNSSKSTDNKPKGEYTLTDSVGLLNTYEYGMAYKNATTSTNYLNIGCNWWLITPEINHTSVWTVSYGGFMSSSTPNIILKGVRPVINLKSTIQLTEGSGTESNPYTIKGDQEEIIPNVTLLNTRQSGEYVEIENDKDSTRGFRIVDTEVVNGNLTTKLVLDDFVKIKSDGSNLKKLFSNDSTYGGGNLLAHWDYFLNTHWITSFDASKLEQGTYYLGSLKDESYKGTVCSTISSSMSVRECIQTKQVVSTTWSGYVGLLRVGEMFASRFGDDNSLDRLFLITPIDSRNIWSLDSINESRTESAKDESWLARPSINLKSDIVIKSGRGMEQDPYKIVIDTFEIEDGESAIGSSGGSID